MLSNLLPPPVRNRKDDPEIVEYIREHFGAEFTVLSCGNRRAYIESRTHGLDVILPPHLRIDPKKQSEEEEV